MITNNSRLNKKSWLKIDLLISVIVLLCMFSYLVGNSPRYIELPILPPDPLNSQIEWDSVEYAIVEVSQFPLTGNIRFYVWRARSMLIVKEKGFNSWKSIFAYFDNQLTKDGWILYDQIYGNLCHLALPESNFLPPGIDGYKIYKHKETNGARYSPIVCLAIQPLFSSDEELWAYQIVLATENPAWWVPWFYLFD